MHSSCRQRPGQAAPLLLAPGSGNPSHSSCSDGCLRQLECHRQPRTGGFQSRRLLLTGPGSGKPRSRGLKGRVILSPHLPACSAHLPTVCSGASSLCMLREREGGRRERKRRQWGEREQERQGRSLVSSSKDTNPSCLIISGPGMPPAIQRFNKNCTGKLVGGWVYEWVGGQEKSVGS